jgi:prepilin-type N-terminal cleavage/methylation domain-containing protein
LRNGVYGTGTWIALLVYGTPPRSLKEILAGLEITQGEHMNRKQKGFSLIELLIVVAIILIIAAIAIPNLLRARMAANETSAVGSLRTINTAAVSYYSTYGIGFPTTLQMLGGVAGAAATCNAAQLIDPVLSAPGVVQKSGYTIALNPGAQAFTGPLPPACIAGATDGYQITAVPVNVGTTGQNSFCTDASGVIRKDPTGGPVGAAVLCPAAMIPLQ